MKDEEEEKEKERKKDKTKLLRFADVDFHIGFSSFRLCLSGNISGSATNMQASLFFFYRR